MADLTVTGNKGELQAGGTVVGNGVRYGADANDSGFGALGLSSDFTAKVPDLDFARVSVSATTQGTFVTIAGQNINEVTAKTDYANKQVTFDATASQPQRTMAAAGSLVIHPDHQEMHLQRLALTTQGMAWQTLPGSEATIRYGNDSVTVNEFALVNGDQRIALDGTFGRRGDSLNVTASDVDVAMIDSLLLRPPQLSGRLNATGTVTGTTGAPQAEAAFTIEQGGFRQFRYDSFGGTANYAGTAITLDTKLLQNPTTWIEARGQVPTALFSEAGWTSSDPIDLRIDSTPIDVGIVQGFTTALTDVTGMLEAHIHVTGTAADPRPDGAVTIRNAAFTLEPNGVTYTDLDGQIDLQADRIHIEQLQVLDNRQSPLTVTGDLALRERKVGEMSIAVKGADFKVIDNEIGNVRVDMDLQLTGQFNATRIEGDLGVTTGRINLDPILTMLGSSAYSTEQTEYTTAADAPAPAPAAAEADAGDQPSAPLAPGFPGMSGLMETLQVDLRLTVPNDLIVEGNDLRAPDGPISLGSVSVTLGGDLYIHQVPYDQLRLYGAVNTVRGTYTFQGRQFTILRDGVVRFDGLDDFNPELDIRAERVIQAVTANVNVRGTFRQPEIMLSSTPPLEQADILSLIVFNQPINQLGTGQQLSLVQRGQALATGAVANELAQSIGNALSLDIFEISTSPDSGAAAELTIGEQVGQNLYLKVRQGIGDQSQTNFILEYELLDWLRLQTNVLQGSSTQQQLFQRMQGSGVDLLFFFSY
jgi:translocation and assembly module TamB